MSPGSLREAHFKARRNRFLVEAELHGSVVECHLPNPGRLRELLVPGATVYLLRKSRAGRKTGHDLVAVRHGSVLVSVDSRLPNRAVGRLLRQRALMEFSRYSTIIPEARIGESRVDFLLRDGTDCYLEVKSCTLVVDGIALFPDAPTERGRRHMEDLASAVRSGSRAAVLFVVQRPDARAFRPNDETDPRFGDALRRAHEAGVEVYAYRSTFDGNTLVGFEPVQTSLRAG
jgi:sugar fermentation stimulation protein A